MDIVQSYLDTKTNEATRKSYQRTLYSFKERLEQKGKGLDPFLYYNDIKKEAEDFVKSRSAMTRNFRITVLSGFYAFEYKVNPILEVERVREKDKTRKIIQRKDLQTALNVIDTKDQRGLRDYALICLFLDSKLTASEISRIKLSDVEIRRESVVHLPNKIITLSSYTSRYLNDWVLHLYKKMKFKDEDPLFTRFSHQKKEEKGISNNGIIAILKKYFGSSYPYIDRSEFSNLL